MKGFIMLMGPRERGPIPQCREPCRRSVQGTDSPKQVGSQERGRTQQQAPLFGVKEESTSKRREGVSLLGLNVTRSLSGSGVARGRTGGRTSLVTRVYLVIWAGCAQPVGENVEASEK